MATLALFLAWERRRERNGGAAADRPRAAGRIAGFPCGLLAALCFFAANMSFYFVLTLYPAEWTWALPPFAAGLTVLPLALAFVVGSRVTGDIVRGLLHPDRGPCRRSV